MLKSEKRKIQADLLSTVYNELQKMRFEEQDLVKALGILKSAEFIRQLRNHADRTKNSNEENERVLLNNKYDPNSISDLTRDIQEMIESQEDFDLFEDEKSIVEVKIIWRKN